MGRPVIDVAGQPFDRLTAIRPTGGKRNGRAVWLCECECGNTAEVTISALCSGDTSSCGCLRREVGRANLAKRYAR